MEITVPFKIEYQTRGSVPIPEIVESLLSIQRVLEEAGKNLENFVPGLTVEKVTVRVQEITHGSLKEVLLIGLFAYFQKDLERDIPEIIKELTGVNVPENTHTLLTILALVAIVYGADFVKDVVKGNVQDTPIRAWKRSLIADLASKSGKSESEVKRILDKRYGVKNRIKQLGDAAVKFFRPSKNQSDAPISIGDRRIDPPIISDAPESFSVKEADKVEKVKHIYGVDLDLHQKDKDREASGWAAIPIGHYNKRLPMKLFDGVTSEQIWEMDRIRGDIVLISKKEGLDFVPSEIHLMKVFD